MEGLGDEEQKKETNDNKEEEWMLDMKDHFFNMLKNDAIGDQGVEYFDQATFTEEEKELMRAEAMAMANAWRNAMLKKGEPPQVPFIYKDDHEGGQEAFSVEFGGRKVHAVEFKPFKPLRDPTESLIVIHGDETITLDLEDTHSTVFADKDKRPKLTPGEISGLTEFYMPYSPVVQHEASEEEEEDNH